MELQYLFFIVFGMVAAFFVYQVVSGASSTKWRRNT